MSSIHGHGAVKVRRGRHSHLRRPQRCRLTIAWTRTAVGQRMETTFRVNAPRLDGERHPERHGRRPASRFSRAEFETAWHRSIEKRDLRQGSGSAAVRGALPDAGAGHVPTRSRSRAAFGRRRLPAVVRLHGDGEDRAARGATAPRTVTPTRRQQGVVRPMSGFAVAATRQGCDTK